MIKLAADVSIPAELRSSKSMPVTTSVSPTHGPTIASKAGSSVGTGSAEIVAGSPGGGRVAVVVTDIRPLAGLTHRFLRLKVITP